jgi:hypothetical protein
MAEREPGPSFFGIWGGSSECCHGVRRSVGGGAGAGGQFCCIVGDASWDGFTWRMGGFLGKISFASFTSGGNAAPQGAFKRLRLRGIWAGEFFELIKFSQQGNSTAVILGRRDCLSYSELGHSSSKFPSTILDLLDRLANLVAQYLAQNLATKSPSHPLNPTHLIPKLKPRPRYPPSSLTTPDSPPPGPHRRPLPWETPLQPSPAPPTHPCPPQTAPLRPPARSADTSWPRPSPPAPLDTPSARS